MRIQGEKVKAKREAAGLTIEQLSEKSGVSAEVLQAMETETYFPAYCRKEIAEALGCRVDDILDMTSSHSEKDILEGCIALMQELTDEFSEYLDFMGVKPSEEEQFWLSMSYFHIVQRLFLYHTSHSGGTSTGMKCRELGVDSGKTVQFICGTPEDEEEDDE